MPSPLRIFVSSPGDVREERLRAQLIIAKLARDYAGLVAVKPYFWESEPLRASGHFQDEIEPPSQHDIVVLILWSRLGTPLPVRTALREYTGIDGRSPVTGTEWEFEDALAAFQARNTPDLLVYRREGDPGASLTDAALRAEQERQWQALQAFWARHFENKGTFLAASARYDSLEAFDARLEADLAKLIERRLAAASGGAAPAHLKGPPYRGLAAYDFSDAPVFFGRDGAVRAGLLRLSEAATRATAEACGFLMVLGASGSGKSSLARAGLLPALVAAKAVPGVGLWRRVAMRPGDAGADPVAALASALLAGTRARGEGLPELAGPGAGATELARHLRASAQDASYPFRTALGALAERERADKALLPHEEARLVLLVDQLEELFTRPDIAEDERLAFVRLLSGLARSGVVWVIATMRSDLWHRAAAMPDLLALTEDGARLDLPPPDGAELLEMVRRPAKATGLRFEENEARLGLDAVLAGAADAEPGALPLLSVVLEDLYRRDVSEGGGRQQGGGRTLTFASYRAMGELKGAIATRAETAWRALEARDPQGAAALPELLRALVTTAVGDAVTARAAPLDAFAPGEPAARLVAAFVAPEVRLLVSEEQAGRAVLRLAHEALIAHWPRAQEQIARDRRDIETRGRLESLLRRYEASAADPRERRRALLSGLPLEEGVDLARRWRIPAADPLGAFVAASARRTRIRRSLGYAAAAGLVLLFAGIALVAVLQTRVADEQRLQAEQARGRTELALGRANREAVLRLVETATGALARADAVTALAAALQASAVETDAETRLSATGALLAGMIGSREVAHRTRPAQDVPWPFALGDDGTLTTVEKAGTAEAPVWTIRNAALDVSRATREAALPPLEGGDAYFALRLLGSRRQALIVAGTRLVLFDLAGFTVVRSFEIGQGVAEIATDGAQGLVGVLTDTEVLILDLASGEIARRVALPEPLTRGQTFSFALDPSGAAAYFVGGGALHTLTLATGALTDLPLTAGEATPVQTDVGALVVQSAGSLRLLAGGQTTSVLPVGRTPRLIDVKTGEVTDVLGSSNVVAISSSATDGFAVADPEVRIYRLDSEQSKHYGMSGKVLPLYVEGVVETPSRCDVNDRANLLACTIDRPGEQRLVVLGVEDTEARLLQIASLPWETDGTDLSPSAPRAFLAGRDAGLTVDLQGFRALKPVDQQEAFEAARKRGAERGFPAATAVHEAVGGTGDGVLYVGDCSGRVVARTVAGSLLWTSERRTAEQDESCSVRTTGYVGSIVPSAGGRYLFVSLYNEPDLLVLDRASGRRLAAIKGKGWPIAVKAPAAGAVAVLWGVQGTDASLPETAIAYAIPEDPDGLKTLARDASVFVSTGR